MELKRMSERDRLVAAVLHYSGKRMIYQGLPELSEALRKPAYLFDLMPFRENAEGRQYLGGLEEALVELAWAQYIDLIGINSVGEGLYERIGISDRLKREAEAAFNSIPGSRKYWELAATAASVIAGGRQVIMVGAPALPMSRSASGTIDIPAARR